MYIVYAYEHVLSIYVRAAMMVVSTIYLMMITDELMT